jgi:peptide deformylase
MPKRVIIFHVPQDRAAPGEGPQGLTILINPVVEPLSDEMVLGWEGCLSVPGLRGQVERHQRLQVAWRDAAGGHHQRQVEGFHARVVQHECDHLDGLLFVDRLESSRAFGFSEELLAAGVL